MKEEGFAHTHKARLSHYISYSIAALATVGLLTSVTAHRFWDDSQYPTKEARELSKWQMLILTVIILSLMLALGTGRLLAKYNIISTLGLEILVVSASSCFMILMVIIPKHYIARMFGHDDAAAIWGVNLGPTDGSLVLYIDLVVTALHLLLPIRWIVLAPLEVIAILAYTVPALLLGSPAINFVPFNIIGLLALTLFAAIGKRAFERQERALFAGLLSEKQMRFQAEFQLSKVDGGEAAKAEDLGSDRSAKLSRPGTTMSAAAFDGSVENASLDQIRAIGQREQWLIASGEVQILPDRVLGEGGFGIVVSGLYHNTLVAVKAPKQDIARKGAICSALPELCNELRILRRVRHPNIAFLYGACMDDALSKLCLVLEFVDGVPLGAFIRGLSRGREGPMEPCDGASEAGVLASSLSARSLIVFDILNVLRYLHSRQPVVVHADLKDSNVFVEERRSKSGRTSYRAKLLDFGLSRILTRNARPLGGTLRWMAPELLSRAAPDAAADCYSFGLLTYFIATGRLPFEGKSPEQVVKRLKGGQPPVLTWSTPADELSQACCPFVEQCAQPKPALRPTAQQVSDELSVMLDHVAGGAVETVVEQLSTGSSGSGSRKSPGVTGPTAADAWAGKEFNGVVEVRQASSSVVSLVPRMGSRDLPPVQEHEVLLTGEAPADGTAAPPPPRSLGSRGQLSHPEYKPTPLSTQTLTLSYLLLQWNVSTSGNACCWLHGALLSLDVVRKELKRRPCSVQQDRMFCGQCDNCGLLMMEGQTSCEFCECPEASGSIDNPTRSEDSIAV